MPRRRSAIPAPLRHAMHEFEKWRSTRATHRIPEELWSVAVELAVELGVHRCARALRLDYASLKRRVESATRSRAPTISSPPAFVEIVGANRDDTACVLEVENKLGVKLRVQLRGVGIQGLTALANSLWRAES